MQDQLQLAADRIQKFKAHAELARNNADKSQAEQSVFDARNELIVIQHCLQNIMTEGELIFNNAVRRVGLKAILDDTTPKEKSDPVQQEQVVIPPQYLGAQVAQQTTEGIVQQTTNS